MNINREKLLINSYNCWWKAPTNLPTDLLKFNKVEKLNIERELNFLVRDFDYFYTNRTFNKSDEALMKNIISNNAKKILNLENLDFADDFLNDFMESTKLFLNKARSFDNEVKFEDIAQAIRNLWIINLFQFLFEKPVKVSDSAFGYSMLYPYTDNVLDSTINSEEKRKIFKNFGERLKGKELQPNSAYEQKLFDLIALLEKDFPRQEKSSIYESFLFIHDAQMESLIQQKNKFTPSYTDDILGITFVKGGSSVLADGFIANKTLSEKEQSIIFNFGVLLQLIDDLQDVGEDLKNGNMTIFSQNAKKYPLDTLINKLLNFTMIITEEIEKFSLSRSSDMAKLIKDNCIYMIFEASSRNKSFFSRKYIREIELYSKVHFSYLVNMRKKYIKKYRKLCKNKKNLEGLILNE